jgi:hypothetical protein
LPAEHSNDCWQFDLSPSDLKEIKEPSWLHANKGTPTLMLFSVVDDRSGVAYQEYRCVYGEDMEAALRFLFNAMAPKQIDGFPFQGIPKMIYSAYSGSAGPRQGNFSIEVALARKRTDQPGDVDHGAVLRSGHREKVQDSHSARKTGTRSA